MNMRVGNERGLNSNTAEWPFLLARFGQRVAGSAFAAVTTYKEVALNFLVVLPRTRLSEC